MPCSSTTTITANDQVVTICYQQPPLNIIEVFKGLMLIMAASVLLLIVMILFLLAAYGLFLLINKAVNKIMHNSINKE